MYFTVYVALHTRANRALVHCSVDTSSSGVYMYVHILHDCLCASCFITYGIRVHSHIHIAHACTYIHTHSMRTICMLVPKLLDNLCSSVCTSCVCQTWPCQHDHFSDVAILCMCLPTMMYNACSTTIALLVAHCMSNTGS